MLPFSGGLTFSCLLAGWLQMPPLVDERAEVLLPDKGGAGCAADLHKWMQARTDISRAHTDGAKETYNCRDHKAFDCMPRALLCATAKLFKLVGPLFSHIHSRTLACLLSSCLFFRATVGPR